VRPSPNNLRHVTFSPFLPLFSLTLPGGRPQSPRGRDLPHPHGRRLGQVSRSPFCPLFSCVLTCPPSPSPPALSLSHRPRVHLRLGQPGQPHRRGQTPARRDTQLAHTGPGDQVATPSSPPPLALLLLPPTPRPAPPLAAPQSPAHSLCLAGRPPLFTPPLTSPPPLPPHVPVPVSSTSTPTRPTPSPTTRRPRRRSGRSARGAWTWSWWPRAPGAPSPASGGA